MVSTGTYLAILLGSIIGAIIAPLGNVSFLDAGIILSVAVAGYVGALFIPSAPAVSSDIQISWNIFAKAYRVIRFAIEQRAGVIVSILGVAYFYFLAATFHAQFPNFTRQTLGADNIVLTMFMVVFSCGIAVGGLLNHAVLKGRVHGGFVPLACLFMGVFGIDIYYAAVAYPAAIAGELHGIFEFLSNIHGLRLFADTFLQAVACGFYVIPMRAIVQERTLAGVRSRVISSSNMMEAIFILLSAVLAAILLGMGDFRIEQLYLTVSVLTLFIGLFLFFVPSLRANKHL